MRGCAPGLFSLSEFLSLDSDLKKLAQEVLELIKSLVGRETFSRAYASLQQTTTEARETRKRKKALEVSHLPVCPACVDRLFSKGRIARMILFFQAVKSLPIKADGYHGIYFQGVS